MSSVSNTYPPARPGVDFLLQAIADLPDSEFVGRDHLAAGVSFIVVDNPPGEGPRLHRHDYEEVFVVLEGEATVTVGGSELAVSGGTVVVVPPGRAHRFVNSGPGRLRQLDIHPRDHFETEWLEG
ncbi:MAG: cupin domain-containing protein [Candidatus Dormiibacterota bacterium]